MLTHSPAPGREAFPVGALMPAKPVVPVVVGAARISARWAERFSALPDGVFGSSLLLLVTAIATPRCAFIRHNVARRPALLQVDPLQAELEGRVVLRQLGF